MSVNPAIIPCLAYRDAHAAIDFLCEAFGFSRNMIYESGDKARIQHAELTLDGNMIMVGSVSSRIGEALAMVTPAETGGKVTASIYVVLPDPDAHHARAVHAGAALISPPTDRHSGGRRYEAPRLETTEERRVGKESVTKWKSRR